MNIIITGHQINVSDHLKTFIAEKTSAKLTYFQERIHNVNVILEKEKYGYKCDYKITSDFGEFHSHSIAELKEVSIDQALDKIIYEIKKKHDKLVKH
ncbi:MAG: ribosome hibernation-promoting factor, HPF/YfiA family [Brevinema sp.]